MFLSNPTLEEAKLYGNLTTLGIVRNFDAQRDEQIAARIKTMPQSGRGKIIQSLKVEMNVMVSRKEEYSPIICAAALDALVQIDIANCLPITEECWRVSA